MVAFDRHNLKDRLGAKRYGQWDAVVCRNALIYFDQPMRMSVATMFADQLRPDGWLMVGAAESLDDLGAPLAAFGPTAARAYRRVAAPQQISPQAPAQTPPTAHTLRLA
jgi:chemotaxis protein methyltransferase CheR